MDKAVADTQTVYRSDQSKGQPQLTLKERIAALQQLNGNASTQRTPSTNRVTSGSSAAVQNRIATFEEKGTTSPPSTVTSPGMSRSPSSQGQNRRRSFYGGEQDDATTMSPLQPSHTGGSFISPTHTGGSFKEPIVRSTDFHAALGRARRAERRTSGAYAKSGSESTETFSRANSPPSSFLLADPIRLVTTEPEAIIAVDMASPPSSEIKPEPVVEDKLIAAVGQDTSVANDKKPEPAPCKDTPDAPLERVPVSPPQPSKVSEASGRASTTDISESESRIQSLDTVRAEKSIDAPKPSQDVAQAKTISPALPSSPPSKAASVKLPSSRPSQSTNAEASSPPSQPEVPQALPGLPKPQETQTFSASKPGQLSQIEGLPSLGFDLADLLQSAAMLEEHLIDGKSPAEQPAPAATTSAPAAQPPPSLQLPTEESSTKSREPSVERHEARPRPKSTLMNTFSRMSNRKSTALDGKDIPVPVVVQPEERVSRPSTPPSSMPVPSDNLSPSKSPGRYFSSLRRLTNGSRSASSATSGSRYSISASSEFSSSEDSYAIVTPSETSEFGSRDSKLNGSSMLSPKKSSHSLGKATSFAGKMFGRSRTKSNNSTTTPNDVSERSPFMSIAPPLPQIPQETFDFKLNVPGIPSSPVSETSTPSQNSPAITRSGAPRLGPISVFSPTAQSSPASAASSPLFDFDSFPVPPTPNTIRPDAKSRSGETIPGPQS